jgi:hypothetical protein
VTPQFRALSPAAAKVAGAMAEHGQPATAKTIAELAGIAYSTTTPALRELRSHGHAAITDSAAKPSLWHLTTTGAKAHTPERTELSADGHDQPLPAERIHEHDASSTPDGPPDRPEDTPADHQQTPDRVDQTADQTAGRTADREDRTRTSSNEAGRWRRWIRRGPAQPCTFTTLTPPTMQTSRPSPRRTQRGTRIARGDDAIRRTEPRTTGTGTRTNRTVRTATRTKTPHSRTSRRAPRTTPRTSRTGLQTRHGGHTGDRRSRGGRRAPYARRCSA